MSKTVDGSDKPMRDGMRPIHQGEIWREEFLGPANLPANALAIALRVPATRIGETINERRGIRPDTALRLARFLAATPNPGATCNKPTTSNRPNVTFGRPLNARYSRFTGWCEHFFSAYSVAWQAIRHIIMLDQTPAIALCSTT